MHVELVAADRKVWEGEAAMVIARTVDGRARHPARAHPLLGILVEGDVADPRVRPAAQRDDRRRLLSVEHDRVTIVAEAVDASSIRA